MITGAITAEPAAVPGSTPAPIPPAGPTGFSAYEIAVQNGFVGTVQQWLASLQGPGADPTSLNAAVSRATQQAVNSATSAGNAAGSAAGAALSATGAAGSATTATAAATSATTSATAAAGSATSAAGSAGSATAQASAASTSAGAASGSAGAAASSATSAGASATAASGAATTAQGWASSMSGTVDGTSYSAKYYAQQAQAAAQQAAAGGIAASGTFAVGDLMVAGNAAGTTAKSGGRPGFVVVDTPSSPYTSINRDEVWWNTASAAAVQILPASPAAGMRVRALRSGANAVTVQQNGNTIAGAATDLVLDMDRTGVELTWNATLATWLVILLQHA